jgi:AmiR/NasT family two-component response regulator
MLARGLRRMARTKIAVAARSPVERATIAEWLDSGGYQPIPVALPSAPPRELEALGFEMLLIDSELMTVGSLMHVARYRPTPRPVVVFGEEDVEAELEAERRGATYMTRPLERGALLFAVTLALAEGRPMRRCNRKAVAPMPATIEGVSSRIIDVSYEGVRLELAAKDRGTVPPVFTLRVPLCDVSVHFQRVWTGLGSTTRTVGTLWCGGALAQNPERAVVGWRALVDQVPAR